MNASWSALHRCNFGQGLGQSVWVILAAIPSYPASTPLIFSLALFRSFIRLVYCHGPYNFYSVVLVTSFYLPLFSMFRSLGLYVFIGTSDFGYLFSPPSVRSGFVFCFQEPCPSS